MPKQKILYITTEMFPYQEESSIAEMVSKMALKMHQKGKDVRVFMPKFGAISERRFQLHEVIRLSGMNIIINDLDQPLIIKVASLPGERLQVYFIDNEEYFKRRFYYQDENGIPFDDNAERAVFFARGVLETVKKLNWVPDVIHFNGWMSSFIPFYLKTFYKNDYYFKNTRLGLSVYNEENYDLGKALVEVFKFDGIDTKKINVTEDFASRKFVMDSMDLVDVVIKGDEFLKGEMDEAFKNTKTQKFEFLEPDSIGLIYE
jgi:starch synthase